MNNLLSNIIGLFTWDNIGKISSVISILASIPILWSLRILLIQRRRQNEILKSIKQNPGNRPMALAIGIGSAPINNQVRAYLQKNKLVMDIESFHLPAMSPDKLQKFVDQLRKIRSKFIERGVDKIHIFYMGPVAAALSVGDVFSNSPALIYHFDKNVGYECWGPLTHPFSF